MNKAKETLVILTPGFAKDEADSTCLPAHQAFVRVLKQMYPQLDLMVLSFQYPYHQHPYRLFNAEIIPFSYATKKGLAKLWVKFRIGRELKRIHSDKKIIGLLSFWCGECARVGKQFGEKYGIPHFCWIRGQDAKKANNYPRRYGFKAEELIALSDFIQDEFEKNHAVRPAHVIPPGVEPENFTAGTPIKDIDLMAAGSLIPLKQYDIFLQVVSQVKKEFPSVKALLAGNGPEKNRLLSIIEKLELASTVTVTGELPHSEVLNLMKRSKIFLHPSSYEAFGVVCLEALAAGCQVISFCRVMKEPVEHWTIVNDKESMTSEAIRLLQNQTSKTYTVIPFTAAQSVEKVMQLFSR